MKKIHLALLLIVITLFIGITDVKGEIYNGRLYEVWHPESGFTVFAAESNGYMDYNSWMIKSTADNKIYYCIDPALPLEGSSSGSHNLYTNKEDILNHTDLTESKYKKVQLLAYYGYGYKDETIDHTNKKWYGITQVMIWRVMRPDLTWTFKANRNATPDNNLYKREVTELNTLVNDYSKLPSFANKNIIVNSGEEIIIEDTNKVFYKYDLNQSSSNIKLTKTGNKLKAYSEYSSPYRIGYEIPLKTNEKFGAFVSSDFQDIIRMGAPEKQKFYFTLEVNGGFITIKKKDFDTKESNTQGEATLKGAVYNIYDSNNNLIKKIETDENGIAKTGIDYGEYILKEEKAPQGYLLNDETESFTVTAKNNHITIDTYDKVIKGKLNIIKTKGGSGTPFIKEENASFDILNNKKTIVATISTNNKGLASIELPYGEYTIHQTKGSKNYVFSSDKQIDILENKEYDINLKDIKLSKLIFSKSDISTSKPVPNTTVEIYKDDDTLIFKGKTDNKGIIEVPNLEIGKYYILEKEAPKYYRINNEKMPFEVIENGKIVKANMKDERKEGKLVFKKFDYNTKAPLKNATIEIYWKDNDNKKIYKAKTNKNGLIEIDKIKAGNYCLKETKAPNGYIKSEKETCFEITEEDQIVSVLMGNLKEIKVPDTMSNIKWITIISIIFLGLGSFILYEVYKKN